jgi:hypothetical protein
MRPAPAGHTTKSDFADNHLRCARSLVSKYVKAGRVVLDDSGRYIHIEASIARIRSTMGAPERAVVLPPPRETSAQLQSERGEAEPSSPFVDAAEKKRYYEAEAARLDYEQRCGQLMDAGRVVHAVTNAATTLRSALEEQPARIAPQLPVPRDVQEQCRLLLAEDNRVAAGPAGRGFQPGGDGNRMNDEIFNVWVVGKYLGHGKEDIGVAWEFCGVFDTREKADAVCATLSHFMGPAVMNEPAPEETETWPGAIYPRVRA